LLLILGAAPFWLRWGRRAGIRAALTGVNAAVVGLLLAALYTPLATSAIRNMTDAALAVSAFLLLTRLKIPAWALVAVALGGAPLLRL
ncbi:chromate transporter, partial [Acinetobacter baumannii]